MSIRLHMPEPETMKLSTHDAALLCAALEAIEAQDSALYCRLSAALPFAPFRSGREWLARQNRHGAKQT